MKRVLPLLLTSASLMLLLQALPAAAVTPVTTRSTYSVPKPPAPAVAKSVTVSGQTYYIVDGNNSSLNSGTKVCASVGLKFTGYASLATNTICKAVHPTAKTVTGVNGSKNGFYCNGAPQKGLACATAMNTCAVCVNCNINATADTQIGDQYAEMYATCVRTVTASSSSKSSSKSSSRSSVSSVPVATGKSCAWTQGTAGGGIHATCNVSGAAGNFCIAVMGLGARAVSCAQNGLVVCNLPCSVPGTQNFTRCPAGATTTAPTGYCAGSTSSTGTTGGKVQPGGLCKTGADCSQDPNLTYCVGFAPDTRCSCSMFSQSTVGCKKNLSILKNQASGMACANGGNCTSGQCNGGFCK